MSNYNINQQLTGKFGKIKDSYSANIQITN